MRIWISFLFLFVSACAVIPRQESEPIFFHNPKINAVQVKVSSTEHGISERKRTTLTADVVRSLQSSELFKSVTATETKVYNFEFIFSHCGENPGVGGTLWFGASVVTLGVIPYWHDDLRCLEVKTAEKTYHYQRDYRFWYSI